ncbi:unnamed protein product [Arabidopsis thaliana]|uniref:Uncharacterized protein n=1 Tax=Arabidopsis thaliana TaxID=3702 RepID=A0A654FG80_ARATH|nr:unnamed protein product [Arabidopsis thaliana]
MDPEAKLILLILNVNALKSDMKMVLDTEVVSVITQIISLVKSMETETELMSLISETIDCFTDMDLESQPNPLRKLISLISRTHLVNSSIWAEQKPKFMLMPLIRETWSMKPQPELISLI